MNQKFILDRPLRRRIGRLGRVLLALFPATILANSNNWSLASPDSRCTISISLNTNGRLSYQVSREGKLVIRPWPLGIRRDDQSFDSELRLQRAGKGRHCREVYELFAGVAPRVDHPLNHRSLVFRNTNNASMTIDPAAATKAWRFVIGSRKSRLTFASFKRSWPVSTSRPRRAAGCSRITPPVPTRRLRGFLFSGCARPIRRPDPGAIRAVGVFRAL